MCQKTGNDFQHLHIHTETKCFDLVARVECNMSQFLQSKSHFRAGNQSRYKDSDLELDTCTIFNLVNIG